MKLIFLDIDGVLNNSEFLNREHADSELYRVVYNDHRLTFCKTPVNNFKKLLDYIHNSRDDIRLVISSCHRFGISVEEWNHVIRDMCNNTSDEIVIGRTPRIGFDKRGLEILEFINIISSRNYIIDDYIIVDDDCGYDIDKYVCSDKCIYVNGRIGLSDKNVDNIKKRLLGEECDCI